MQHNAKLLGNVGLQLYMATSKPLVYMYRLYGISALILYTDISNTSDSIRLDATLVQLESWTNCLEQ